MKKIPTKKGRPPRNGRTITVALKVSKDEYLQIVLSALKQKITISEYLRSKLFKND